MLSNHERPMGRRLGCRRQARSRSTRLIAAVFNAADLDAFVELHEQGAVSIVPPEGRTVTGHAQIRAALAPIFALRPAAQIDVVGKLEVDGLALTHARVHVVATRDHERIEVTGRGTIVSRRQADGSWRIVLDNPMSPS